MLYLLPFILAAIAFLRFTFGPDNFSVCPDLGVISLPVCQEQGGLWWKEIGVLALLCLSFLVFFVADRYKFLSHVFLDNLVYTPGKTKSLKLCGVEMSLRAFQTRLGGEGNLETSPGFVSTTYGQENFTLKEGSRAKGHGYGGVDLGAYPVYGAVPTGPEERNDPFAVQAGFDAYASRLERGAEMSFTVRLSHACREELRLALQPVAGEARVGEDFILSTDEMVFLPGETAKSFTVEGVGSI